MFRIAYHCHFGTFILIFVLVLAANRMLLCPIDLCTIASSLRLAVCLLLVAALLLFLSS
jgi:hypothetical protein